MGGFGRVVLVLLAAGTAASCTTLTPVVLSAPKRPDTKGLVSTSVYTGNVVSDDRSCRGTFGQVPDGAGTRLEVSCRDGRHGTGTAVLEGGRFVRGSVRLDDGAVLTIRTTGLTFP